MLFCCSGLRSLRQGLRPCTPPAFCWTDQKGFAPLDSPRGLTAFAPAGPTPGPTVARLRLARQGLRPRTPARLRRGVGLRPTAGGFAPRTPHLLPPRVKQRPPTPRVKQRPTPTQGTSHEIHTAHSLRLTRPLHPPRCMCQHRQHHHCSLEIHPLIRKGHDRQNHTQKKSPNSRKSSTRTTILLWRRSLHEDQHNEPRRHFSRQHDKWTQAALPKRHQR